MKPRHAEYLLAGVIVARATSLLFSTISMRTLGPFNLMAVRFLLAFLILAVIFFRRLREIRLGTVLRGLAVGGTFFAVMACELKGLKLTDSSTTSFLENTAIVWMPLMEAALHHHLPGRKSVRSALVTLSGVGLLTLGKSAFHLGLGEGLCLVASLLYAAAIILTDRLSRQDDPLLIGILQVGFIGLFGLIASLQFEAPHLPQTGTEWSMILALALVCSCFGFTLQPVAQRYVSSERAGMFCALNPLTAAVLGAVFLQERIGLLGLLGAMLILAGILIQTVKLRPARPRLVKT